MACMEWSAESSEELSPGQGNGDISPSFNNDWVVDYYEQCMLLFDSRTTANLLPADQHLVSPANAPRRNFSETDFTTWLHHFREAIKRYEAYMDSKRPWAFDEISFGSSDCVSTADDAALSTDDNHPNSTADDAALNKGSFTDLSRCCSPSHLALFTKLGT